MTDTAPTSAKKASDDAAGVKPKAAAQSDPFDGAVDYLNDNYDTKKSTGKCTYAIKKALDGQELNGTTYKKGNDGSITGRDFIDNNGAKLGYESTASGTLDSTNASKGPDGYTPQKGDIAVFEPTDNHKYGHIQMYDGEQWRSDFKQNNFSPGSGYTKDGVPYTVYRNKASGSGGGESQTKAVDAKGKAKPSTSKDSKVDPKAKAPEAKKVTNTGKQIATTTSGHKATTKTPTDVHHNAKKPELTAPFMNFVGSDRLVNPSLITFIQKGKIWLGPFSHLIPSDPDHAGWQPGVKTKRYKDEARATSWSTNLFVEGFLCVRTDDKTTQNFKNTTGVVVGKEDKAKKGKGEDTSKGKAKKGAGAKQGAKRKSTKARTKPKNASDLILSWELGGGNLDAAQTAYDKKSKHPHWPGNSASGLTIGVGYDLNQQSAAQFEADWKDKLDPDTYERLKGYLGKSGSAAAVADTADIEIPWETAQDVYNSRVLPRYEASAAKVFPGYDKMPADTQAALTSVVYNYGTGYGKPGQELKKEAYESIQTAVANGDSQGVADGIRQLKDYNNAKNPKVANGLNARREDEATFVEGTYK